MINTCLRVVFIFALLGCQSAPTRKAIEGKLDGEWVVSAYECDSGKLNKSGVEANDRLKSGTENYQYSISGEEVRIFLKTLTCEHNFTQTWKMKDSSIAVTDGNDDDVKPLGDIECKPYPTAKPRTHEYERLGSLLKIKLSNEYSVFVDKDERLCTKGRDVAIFSRVR